MLTSAQMEMSPGIMLIPVIIVVGLLRRHKKRRRNTLDPSISILGVHLGMTPEHFRQTWCLKADETAAGMVHSNPRDGSNHLRYLKTARMNSSILRSPRKNTCSIVRLTFFSLAFCDFARARAAKKKEVQSAAQRTEFVMHMNSVSLPEFTQRNQWI